MSNLKNKSEINRSAADLLQSQSMYPSVIHCAYYSCLQFMKHLLINTIGKSETEIAVEVRNSTNGSHEVLNNNIITHMKSNDKDWRSFNNKISQLKRLRTVADYDNVSIDSVKGNNSIVLSDELLRILRSNVK